MEIVYKTIRHLYHDFQVEKDPIEVANLTQINAPESIKKLIVKNWSESNSQLKNDFIIKEESDRFTTKDESNDFDDRDYDSGSEEDDLPLATITGNSHSINIIKNLQLFNVTSTEREPNKEHKKKDRKKLSRQSPKSKRKKKLKNKAKLKILENIFNEVVALKEENKSDEENFSNGANDYQLQISNTVETTKLKRNKLDDSFLRLSSFEIIKIVQHLLITSYLLQLRMLYMQGEPEELACALPALPRLARLSCESEVLLREVVGVQGVDSQALRNAWKIQEL